LFGDAAEPLRARGNGSSDDLGDRRRRRQRRDKHGRLTHDIVAGNCERRGAELVVASPGDRSDRTLQRRCSDALLAGTRNTGQATAFAEHG